MKNINLRKKAISLLLTTSFILLPINTNDIDQNTINKLEEFRYDSNEHRDLFCETDLITGTKYDNWYICDNNAYFDELLYQDINNYLPPFMINAFKNYGWTLHLCRNQNTINYQTREIYLNTSINLSINDQYLYYYTELEHLDYIDNVQLNYLYIKSNMFHLFGHMLDNGFRYSTKKEWKKIVSEANTNLSESEFFASTFETFILYNSNLKTSYPEAYNYIKNIIYEKESLFEEKNPGFDYLEKLKREDKKNGKKIKNYY